MLLLLFCQLVLHEAQCSPLIKDRQLQPVYCKLLPLEAACLDLCPAPCPRAPAADAGRITIGDKTNIQDGCVIGTAPAYLGDHAASTRIGRMTTIGHQASLHGCTVGDRALIGMNATLLEGSVVRGSWVRGQLLRQLWAAVEQRTRAAGRLLDSAAAGCPACQWRIPQPAR